MASFCIANPIDNLKDDSKASGLTNYDQRQTGKYNLHVNIKDVQFFAISDSLAGIGGDYETDYGDYAPLESEDSDYDISHLTVNPIFAFLGSKPTSPKPSTTTTTTTPAAPIPESTTLKPDSMKVQETTTTSKTSVNNQPSTTDASVSIKQDIESESKPDLSTSTIKITTSSSESTKKPPQMITTPPKVNETIDYEEIPVEVLYYRNQVQKEQQAKRRHDNGNLIGNRSKNNKRQPAVVVIDDFGRNSNVKILSDNSAPASVPMVKICGRGEFRDQLGRCRVRSLLKRDANQHHVRVPGM